MAKKDNKRNDRYNDNFYAYHRPDNGGQYHGDFEDISSSSGRSGAAAYGGRRRRKRDRSILSILLALLIIIAAAIAIFIGQLMLRLNTTSISKDPDELGVMAGVDYGSDITNIALFGLDDRTNTFNGRSDAIMVLTIDQKESKVKITSLLRDSRIYIDGYGEDKLNHAYSYGGPELAIRTLNQNYQMDIMDYVTVNFYNMAEIVDAFGGTVVTVSEAEMREINANLDMLIAEGTDLDVKATDYMSEYGEVRLNGMQAVAYSRIRSIDSDAARAQRQQEVMIGLLGGMSELSFTGYINLANTILPLCETSMNVQKMARLAPALLGRFEVETLTVPGAVESASEGYTNAGSWVYIYDLDYAARHIDAFIKEEDSEYWHQFYG